ncbi:hypothetical protein [Shewanella sp.]|uniref:hypothetical protein n=1 Tax=Shewanella sp. TaxID=50422 RepID=UPI0040540224
MGQLVTILVGVLGTIAAIISIYTAFPTDLTVEQKYQLGVTIIGWIIALCLYVAYAISKQNIASQSITHQSVIDAMIAQHAIEKATLERNLAKGYESYLMSELSKTSSALVYTSQLLNPQAPIPKATPNTKGNNDEF